MAIPDFQSIMLPLLRFASDGACHNLSTARTHLAQMFSLTQKEIEELLPSGKQRRFHNRVAWAKVYLEQAGLLHSPKRGEFNITQQGLALLASNPDYISVQLLNQFEKFKTFRIARKSTEKEKVIESIETPEELLERSFQNIHRELVRSLLEKVKACTPSFFENLVIELLLKMGYGGNRIEAGKAIGQSGDEGIDGIINEDKLGLDIVYIQAKRWTTATIGRPEIQKFVGALHGERAKKGVYITTSTFSPEAHQYVLVIDPKVVLIDGEQLAEYMIEYNLGVLIKDTYEIKKIDADYFIED